MSLTNHDLKLLLHCAVFMRLLFFLLMPYIFREQEYIMTVFIFIKAIKENYVVKSCLVVLQSGN